MFTPHMKSPWTPANSAARTTVSGVGVGSRLTAAEKGKSLAFTDDASPSPPPPPPRSSFKTDISRRNGDNNSEDWKRFKEADLIELAIGGCYFRAMSHLLFDYQYNMGLLLIEKENLVSKNEELGQEFAEAQEILKREKTAHVIAISEAEQREENLKKALGLEKKCLVDLERALRDMHEEHAKLKASSETSMADINTHLETLEKKRLDLEAKSHVADAKLAAAEKKNSELDMKLQDLETRERILQREHISLTEEKEAHQTYFQKHKKDLMEWERKLQEGEQKLCDSRRILREREEKLHEIESTSREKEAYMDELQQKIDLANATLKKMELDMEIKLADLDSKEKKAESLRCKLETSERELLEKEKRLSARESVELENLLRKHKTELDAKMHEFELEMKKKRNAMEEEFSTRRQEIDASRSEINHLEEMLGKKEHALEKKSERVKEKEKDIDIKIKALKEREKTMKAEEKSLELEKKEINADREGMEDLKKELETWRTNLREHELKIEEGQKEVEVLQEERSNYIRLQTNLKQEYEIARRQSVLIEKEAGELKLEREKFEKDWEALDEKRAAVDNKLKLLEDEKASFEKLQKSEEDRMKRERAERDEHLRLESERIRLEKESFEASKEQQKKMYDEKAKNEHILMFQDLEREKRDFYNDVEKRQSELRETMEEKERAFEERTLKEMGDLSRLKEDTDRKMKDMETERHRLEKEREEMELIKKQLEETRVEMSTDVETLDNLSKTMKKQREEFASERRLFTAFIEQIKGCRNCGDSAQAFLRSDLLCVDDSYAKTEPMGLSAKMYQSPATSNKISLKSGGQMSVLRKCASIIFKSPKDKSQPTDDHKAEPLIESKKVASATIDESGPSLRIVNKSSKNSPSDVILREDSLDTATPSVDVSDIASVEQGVQESENTVSKTGRRKPGRKRVTGVRRTHSVKAVVEDAKAILGESSDTIVEAEIKHPAGARKRTRLQESRVTESEQDFDHSEGIADSATTGGRRKRRQTSAADSQNVGQRRYNLRRHTAVETTSGKPVDEEEAASKRSDQMVQNPKGVHAPSLDAAVDSSSRLNLVQVSTTRSIEISSDRILRFPPADQVDNHFEAGNSLQSASLIEEAKLGENKVMNEEVNENEDDPNDDGGISDGGVDDGEDGDGDDDGDDSDGHPGQKSIGKKLWNFFTT
ncbi:hypothetical protein KSS87_010561 [Heliosperma pusillum]|nr:hypothetical protein KSS87_010561 [Heliosperma pusillum]